MGVARFGEVGTELQLEGLDDDGHGQAEAAGGEADSAPLLPGERAAGLIEVSFELGEWCGFPDEVIEVRHVAVAYGQELNEAALASGSADLVKGEVDWLMGHDEVEQVSELGIGAAGGRRDCGALIFD